MDNVDSRFLHPETYPVRYGPMVLTAKGEWHIEPAVITIGADSTFAQKEGIVTITGCGFFNPEQYEIRRIPQLVLLWRRLMRSMAG